MKSLQEVANQIKELEEVVESHVPQIQKIYIGADTFSRVFVNGGHLRKNLLTHPSRRERKVGELIEVFVFIENIYFYTYAITEDLIHLEEIQKELSDLEELTIKVKDNIFDIESRYKELLMKM